MRIAATRELVRGILAFALVAFAFALLCVGQVSILSYAAGGGCVAAAWLVMPDANPLSAFRVLTQGRASLVVPVFAVWPLSSVAIIVLLAEQPRAIFFGALLAAFPTALLVAFSLPT